MECIISDVNGGITIHTLVYASGSVFVWISDPKDVALDDFHIATPDKYSKLPALSSRMGDTESRGRGLALRITKRFGIQCIVSWCIGDQASIGGDIVKSVESKVFEVVESAQQKYKIGIA